MSAYTPQTYNELLDSPVSYAAQTLTDPQKAQALTNLGAASVAYVGANFAPISHNHSADQITSGRLSKDRQNVQTPYLDQPNTWAQPQTFANALNINGNVVSTPSANLILTVGSAWNDGYAIQLLNANTLMFEAKATGVTCDVPLTVGAAATFSGDVFMQGVFGGWPKSYAFKGSAGTNLGGWGALGTTDTLEYLWAGPAFNNYFIAHDGASFSSKGINSYLEAPAGGWGAQYAFKGSSGTNRGGFGAVGTNDALSYYWIGPSFSSPYITLSSTGTTVSGALNAESYRAFNGYFVSQESGVDKWMSYSVSGTFYLRDAVNSRSHAIHHPGVNAAAALTQFSSRILVEEAATFNGAVSASGSVSVGPITKSALLALTASAAAGEYRITDSTPAQRRAYPDGTNWRYSDDSSIVT